MSQLQYLNNYYSSLLQLTGADKCWSCKTCSKWYKHRDSLRRHIRDECGKMPRHQCHICQAYFYHRHNLKTHSLSKHHILI
ncbi:zinc finger protein 25-like [Melanaphis sacchari]|uniref:zinc finger protein 25-like n=1 Tax=Melanaphis sacchari TaxID=742174 RepID=UPI000DC159E1|nr:zinc finger protein 25-like [Melanaphis sacchari]